MRNFIDLIAKEFPYNYTFVEYMHIKDALPDGRVVPSGAFADNVPAIVAKYAGQGGVVLSLGPHLALSIRKVAGIGYTTIQLSATCEFDSR